MLNNKTVLVAGAGGLLGVNVVKAILAQNGSVIAFDIDIELMKTKLAQAGINTENEKLELLSLDITNEVQIKRFFNSTIKLCGAVNCSYPRNQSYGAHFLEVSLDSFNENTALHLGSTFLFLQCCAEYFNRIDSPISVVNIASIYGVVAPKFDIYEQTSMTMPVEYAAIKSAVVHLTKYVSKYVDDSRFRVNCVSPGGLLDDQPEGFLNAYKKKTNGLGMLGADDITGTIVFLLSDLSKAITGQNIVVDDGFSL